MSMSRRTIFSSHSFESAIQTHFHDSASTGLKVNKWQHHFIRLWLTLCVALSALPVMD